jgi:hypothetical protein
MARVRQTKLTPAAVTHILLSTEHNSVLAAQYGVTRQAISLIRNGKNWTDVSPELPRVPIRVKESIRKDYIKQTQHCFNCLEYQQGECAFGFPEAIDEPTFAAICDLYKRDPSRSTAVSS